MTKAEAVAIFESKEWRQWSDVEKVRRQLYEERLMMPFDEFQGAVERAVGYPVWTHQFGSEAFLAKLKADFEAKHALPF